MNSLLNIFSIIWPYTLPYNILLAEIILCIILIKKYSSQNFRIINLITILFIICLLLISDLLSSIFGSKENPNQIFFYFKYIIIFLIFHIDFYRNRERKKEYKFILLFFSTAIIISIYEYIYFFPKFSRIGTPGVMTNNNLSDAHLYSAILSLFFIQVIKLNFFHGKYLILGLIFITILLTGSRTGILCIALYSLINFNYLMRFAIRKIYWILVGFACISYFIHDYIFKLWDFAHRGFRFNLLNDASSSIRIQKVKLAFLV